MTRSTFLCKHCGQPIPSSGAYEKLVEVRKMLGLPEQGTQQQVRDRIAQLVTREAESKKCRECGE